MDKLNLTKDKRVLLEKILSKVGDLNFKRRIIAMLEYLDIKEGDYILDMGCGEGFYALIFDKVYNVKVEAVDYDEKILALAKNWLHDSKNVNLTTGDICNLKYKDNTFDKIVCTEVLEHIVDHEKATSELYRVLKPKGVIAATVPNKNYPFMWDPLNKIREGLGLGHFDTKNGLWGGIWAYDHKRLYSPQDFKELFEDHKFKVADIKVMTHYGVPFNHLVLYVGKNLYTSLPVPEDLKNTMEKFKWDSEEKAPEIKKSIFSHFVLFVFNILKKVDDLNDKDFSLDTSTMAVALKAVKD